MKNRCICKLYCSTVRLCRSKSMKIVVKRCIAARIKIVFSFVKWWKWKSMQVVAYLRVAAVQISKPIQISKSMKIHHNEKLLFVLSLVTDSSNRWKSFDTNQIRSWRSKSFKLVENRYARPSALPSARPFPSVRPSARAGAGRTRPEPLFIKLPINRDGRLTRRGCYSYQACKESAAKIKSICSCWAGSSSALRRFARLAAATVHCRCNAGSSNANAVFFVETIMNLWK